MLQAKRSVGWSMLAIGVMLARPDAGYGQVQTTAQQGCINALNKSGSKVAKTQGKENAACVKNAGKGVVADAQACLTADAKLKVSKAKAKTAITESKKCPVAPDFGFAPSAQINAAAADQEVALTADVFGVNLTAAIIPASSDKDGAGCQAAVVKAYEKIATTKLKTFLKCKKAGLKAGTILSAATLEACFDTVSADAKVAAMVTKLAAILTSKCGTTTLATAFPGDCSAAGDFPACVDEQVECRVCLTLDAMDGLSRNCDLFDDGLSNSSCAVAPPTTTSSTTTSSTTTTMPPGPDWGLDCFPTGTCGPSFCPMNGLQCTDFIQSVGLTAGLEMCFFDCMDGDPPFGFEDVTACRDACAGGPIPPPPCDMTVAGGGGFAGVVTGPGKCTPSGFAATVSFGGTASELKRVLVDFATAIDESTLFSSAPPPCSGTCPSPGSACDVGAPYPATPLPSHFRLQIGTPGIAAEVCERSGVPTTVCKYSATGYAFVFSLPPPPSGIDLAGAPIDVTLFVSCHVESSGGGTFLHFSSGDFYATGTF